MLNSPDDGVGDLAARGICHCHPHVDVADDYDVLVVHLLRQDRRGRPMLSPLF